MPEGTPIYILGSIHNLPLHKCLGEATIQEIESIASCKAVLYIEHEPSNKENLKRFREFEIQADQNGKSLLNYLTDCFQSKLLRFSNDQGWTEEGLEFSTDYFFKKEEANLRKG